MAGKNPALRDADVRDPISANDDEYAGEWRIRNHPTRLFALAGTQVPLKRTLPESVLTDLRALSRGFIPGGIVVLWDKKPALRGADDNCRAGFQSRR